MAEKPPLPKYSIPVVAPVIEFVTEWMRGMTRRGDAENGAHDAWMRGKKRWR
jgi:hypothetical protein